MISFISFQIMFFCKMFNTCKTEWQIGNIGVVLFFNTNRRALEDVPRKILPFVSLLPWKLKTDYSLSCVFSFCCHPISTRHNTQNQYIKSRFRNLLISTSLYKRRKTIIIFKLYATQASTKIHENIHLFVLLYYLFIK